MKKSSFFCSHVLLAAVMLASAGCLPGPAWLPDSSGLVYVTKKGELCLFDVATGKVQVMAKTDTQTIWPAVSPDGQRFAVAKVQKHHAAGTGFDTQYKTTCRVLIHDRRCKVEHESAEMEWGPARVPSFYHDPRSQVQLFWTPERNREAYPLRITLPSQGANFPPKWPLHTLSCLPDFFFLDPPLNR